jgi:plastocyanin
VIKVRGNRTANLLAIGMVGTAVAFNLQSHAALIVIGDHLGGFTQVWHDLGVHVLAGVAYVFALLLFPDGSIERSRGPHLVALAVVFGLLSFVAISDHTSALVLLFGVLVPAAALVAHSRSFREAQTPELRQLYRLLRTAMAFSLVGAVAVLTVTSVLKSRDERFTETTRDYELVAPEPGAYFFYCDPHTADMRGVVLVRDGSSSSADPAIVSITAHGSDFDKDTLELESGRTTVVRFTNTDGTEHNVAIYRDVGRRDPVFVGELFSGQDLATFTFRVFRFVFALIPVALFVAILRFHLWDVDRLVNRAMVYGALTGVLGLAYGVGALVVGLVPGAIFNQGELVLLWIFAAALLFRPIRRRLQAAIDRRFYREKLDTVRTLESFAVHVRDQVDLEELADELVTVVSDTMHPNLVSLWIRDGESAPVSSVPGSSS